MKIVVSLTSPDEIQKAVALGADLIELRLDLMDEDLSAAMAGCSKACAAPLIATLRSREEGGAFTGDPDRWFSIVQPFLDLVDYVDVERRFRRFAPLIRYQHTQVIASAHINYMPPPDDLKAIERDLRSFGDIPKIAVTPSSTHDLLDLLAFTLDADKPLITSVQGAEFRYARTFLPFFGSEMVYCHIGTPTAKGQYDIRELQQLKELLTYH
ncbi:3-dehydroquinate dehydratase [Methanofollis liminatans DSM 4140]|jgi:3-dehydroquinate dehydratase-1|uniref:3-dehydroquinate dehydratase n=1 Tax=Methanofollis liminatans DSM 4140 TaxID=28892 RepID=J1AT51_9EURY|nr:type I 3-dehydroquinate dehydratase [Methanofollis liminatans]EJG08273.1 3-dehydroquinate dehydratase [Methanofollis liminatans DSM 4140]